MSQATELIAQQMAQAANIKKVWGTIIFNVKDLIYAGGAAGNGIVDDTSAVQAAVNDAVSKNATLVFFPPGSYKVTALTNTSTINFVGDNATFVGYVGTITEFGVGSRLLSLLADVDASVAPTDGQVLTYNSASSKWKGAPANLGKISITEFSNLVLNPGTVNEDWKDAFAAAVTMLKAQDTVKELVFPAGIYRYTVSPNWAIQYARIVADGEVILRYAGTGNAVILDGSTNTVPVAQHVFNMYFGHFYVEAPATAKDAVFLDMVSHSKIDVTVRGSGAAYSGAHICGAVCCEFSIKVTVNEEGWYLGAKPTNGILLKNGVLAGATPSYNIFYNAIVEGTIEGCRIDDGLGNTFLGGTMEGCGDTGLLMGTNAALNKFFSVDFEANTGNDITCNGYENHFFAIDSNKTVDFGATAKDNAIFGGSFKNIIFETGSTRNLVDGVKYNRQLGDGTTGLIVDNGTYNRVVNSNDVKNAKVGNRPTAVTAVTVGASPFAYTNTSGNDERMFITGGTISSVSLQHGVTGDSVLGYSGNFTTLSPGDILTVAYSVAPTMRKYTT